MDRPKTVRLVLAYALAGALACAVLGTGALLAGARLGEKLDGPLGMAGLMFQRVGWAVAGWVTGAAVGFVVGLVRGRAFSVTVAGSLAGVVLWAGGPDQPWLRVAALAAAVGVVGGAYAGLRHAPWKKSEGGPAAAERESSDAVVIALGLLLAAPAP